MIKVFSETQITLYSYGEAELEVIEDSLLAYELPSYAIYSFYKANEDIMLTDEEIRLCYKIAERKNKRYNKRYRK